MRVFLVFLLLLCSSCLNRSNRPQYGDVVAFSEGRELLYPDFDVRYVGRRREVTEQYPRGFVYYDFEISSEEENMTVSWTAGTGAIAPVRFSFGGQEYMLVLKVDELRSEDYMLDDNEMIVWPEDVYLRKLKNRR